jgi:hypothetical protein
MAGITRREREDRQRIWDIKRKLADPSLPHYLFAKLQGTLNTLQRVQDGRVAERQAKVTRGGSSTSPRRKKPVAARQ